MSNQPPKGSLEEARKVIKFQQEEKRVLLAGRAASETLIKEQRKLIDEQRRLIKALKAQNEQLQSPIVVSDVVQGDEPWTVADLEADKEERLEAKRMILRGMYEGGPVVDRLDELMTERELDEFFERAVSFIEFDKQPLLRANWRMVS